MMIDSDGWVSDIIHHPIPFFHKRTQEVSIIVLHSIALPPQHPDLQTIINFFSKKLTVEQLNDYFIQEVAHHEVSTHFLIGRQGELIQLVSLHDVAWHCGRSYFAGKDKCNEFSIGIELVGTEFDDFTSAQYQALGLLIPRLCKAFRIDKSRIVRHRDISPGRKTDPGIIQWGMIEKLFQ